MTRNPPASPREAETKARESLTTLRAALRATAKNPDKAEPVHDLRVAIRRFKQLLRVYAAYFDRARKMRRGLRGLMDLCGGARNCDVALEVLHAAGAPAGRGLKREFKKHRAGAARELAATLKDWRVRSHMHRWREWLKAESGPGVARALPKLDDEFLKAGAAAARAGAPYRRMHKFRLLVKKTRYASEILGAPAAQIEQLRALQDRLGAINDCVTIGDLIGEMKVDEAERRRIKAALNRLAAKRAGEFRAYWRAHFGRKGVPRKTK